MVTLCCLMHAQLAICDDLEAIADSLPAPIDKKRCASAAGRLAQVFEAVHRLEDYLIPGLRASADAEVARFIERSVDRLSHEHHADEDLAREVCELLESLVFGPSDVHMEQAGYMLRGFFASLRRHVAFDVEVLLPLASRVLERQDLRTIAEQFHDGQVIMPLPCAASRQHMLGSTSH